jgi:hypothetical protein
LRERIFPFILASGLILLVRQFLTLEFWFLFHAA